MTGKKKAKAGPRAEPSTKVLLRAHEEWSAPSFGEKRAFGAQGPLPFEDSHPVLVAIRAAVMCAREHASEIDGDYDIANLVEAVGELAGFAVFVSRTKEQLTAIIATGKKADRVKAKATLDAMTRDAEARRTPALNWARGVLRPDRAKDPEHRGLARMAADSRHPLERDDVVFNLNKIAVRVFQREAYRDGKVAPSISDDDAWARLELEADTVARTANLRHLAADAYAVLFAGHHLLLAGIPDRDTFMCKAIERIEAARRRANSTAMNYVGALLRAWGVEKNDAKNAVQIMAGTHWRFAK